MSPTSTRRRFLSGLASAAAVPALASAAQPWNRSAPRFSGLSLAAYSLRKEFAWFKGQPTEGRLDLFAFLDYCASLGLSGAELTAYFFPEPADAALCHRIKRHAHLLGLDLTGGAIGNNFSHPPGSDEAKAQLAYTKRWIDLYAEMGIPTIRVFAGNPAKGVPADEAISRIIANLSEALEHAAARGVLLGVENHDFTTNVDRFLAIVTAIDSPWLGATFDSANVEPTSDPYAQMERIAPYAVTAQIKAMVKTTEGPQPTDYRRVMDLLRKHHYRGYVVLEYEEEHDPREAIPRHLQALREAMDASAGA
jgi:sugar phosphate isomerase/epimerase